jgi:hypothetical protein
MAWPVFFFRTWASRRSQSGRVRYERMHTTSRASVPANPARYRGASWLGYICRSVSTYMQPFLQRQGEKLPVGQ